MKNLTILFTVFSLFISLLSHSQTLYSDEHGVRLTVEIQDTGKTVSCENSWDRNYTDKPIKVWEVSLIFRNGSSKKVKPKLTGIATINVIPSDGKVLDYCGYKNINRNGVENKGQQLVSYTIFHPRMPIVDAGARISSSAYLYLYSDAKPILDSWNFSGYDFLDGNSNPKIKVNANSEETLFEDNNVKVYYKIEDTGKTTKCKNDWDANYTDKAIKVYKVSLTIENKSDSTIIPAVNSAASIDIKTCPYLIRYDYCGQIYIDDEYGRGTFGRSDTGGMVFFGISNLVGGIPPNKIVRNMRYLYAYEGLKPLLDAWEFGGYRFSDNNRLISNGGSGRVNGDIHYQAWMNYNDRKIKTNFGKCGEEESEEESSDSLVDINSEIKKTIKEITNIEIDSSFVDLKAIENAVEQNPDYYDELTNCMESGNAKYYRDKLENVSTTNLKSMQAYSWLSIFYSYQCECEIGSTRPEQLVRDMNQLVTTFNNSTRNSTFAPLKKVYQCKKIESNTELEKSSTIESQSNSDDIIKVGADMKLRDYKLESVDITNTEFDNNSNSVSQLKSVAIKKIVSAMKLRDDEVETVNIISTSKNSTEALTRLKERNIQKLNNYTLDALNKLTNEIPNFPLTGSEIQTLVNGGSFNDVIKNYNLRASNELAQNLGLDYNQTQALNIIATSESKEEMAERLKQSNIQQISQKTADGIQKMLGDSYGSFPITSGDISEMLRGNIEGALTNIKYNQDINNISQLTGGDTELASGIYDLASVIGQGIRLKRLEKGNDIIQKIKSYERIEQFRNPNGDFKSAITFNYIGDFNDSNWQIENTDFAFVEVTNDSIIKFIPKEIPKYKDRDLDYPMLVFNNQNFSVGKDFTITFELGFPIKKMYQSDDIYRSGIASMFSIFLSNTNRISLSSKTPSITNNFNSVYDFSKTKSFEEIRELDEEVFKKLFYSYQSVINEADDWDWSSSKTIRKSNKRIASKWKELYKANKHKASDFDDEHIFTKYKIIKKDASLYLKVEFQLDGETEILEFDKPFEYKYLDIDKLYIGVGFNGFYRYGMGVQYFGSEETIIVKNLIIEQ